MMRSSVKLYKELLPVGIIPPQRMFGYTEKEAIGKHISLIIPKDRLSEETKIIESIRRGEKIDHFETERVAKDGTNRYFL